MSWSHWIGLDHTECCKVEHTLRRLLDVVDTSTQVERYIQILRYIDIDVRTEVPTIQYMLCTITTVHLSTLGIPHTLLAQIRETYIVASTLISTAQLQVGAILWCSVTIQLIRPRSIEILILTDIIIGKSTTIAYVLIVVYLFLRVHRIHTAQVAHLIAGKSHIVRVLGLHLVGQGLEANLLREINLGLTSGTTLGSYHDNTIGTTHTIDRRSGSILQHRDALDRISIEEGEVTLHIIYDNQWRTSTLVGGTDTTDEEEALRPSWLRRPLVSLYTIECRGEGILKNGNRVLLQFLASNH